MAIYMKYSSPNIKGGVTTGKFEGQTNISSFQWGIGRGVGSPIGGATNREASTPSISEIVMTKDQDEASGPLLQEAYSGAGKATVVLSFVRTDAKGAVAFMEYTLSDVMLSSWSTSAGADGKPSESFSLNFTKVETKFIAQAADGTEGDAFPVTYDLTTQTMS